LPLGVWGGQLFELLEKPTK